jgi:hypothetical protein
MVAGLNILASIRKIAQSTDDSSGGSVTTGTVVHENVRMRIQQQPEEPLLLQQGAEILKTFTALCTPVTLDIDENYEVEVTAPTTYYLYGKPLKVINHRPADFLPSDSRNYVLLTMTRSHEAHETQ